MDFLSYAQSLNPAILSLPITGCLTPYDTYQRAVSVSGNPKWLKKNNRFGFHPNESGYYVVTNNTEHQITSFSLFVFFGEPLYYSGIGYSKIMIDCSNFWRFGLYENGGAQRIYVRDQVGTNTRYLTSDWSGKISVGVSVTNNQLASFYYDGVYAGPSNSTVPITASTQDITIGANSLAAAFIDKPIQFAAMFPGEITSENFSYLHNEASKMQIVPHKIKTHYVPTQINSPKVSISGPPNANRIIPDKSGNNNHGEIIDNVSVTNTTNKGHIYQYNGDGSGRIQVYSDSSFQGSLYNSYVFNIKMRGTKRLLEKKTGGSGYFTLFEPGGQFYLNQYFDTDYSQWKWDYPSNVDFHMAILQDKSNPATDPRVFINGHEISVTQTLTGSGNVITDVGADLVIGNNKTFTSQGKFDLSSFNFYDKLLSDSENRNEYLDCALNHVIKYTNRFEHPVTFSSVSAPGNVGPYRTFGSNSHQYLDNGSSRYLLHNDIDGIANLQLAHSPYGAFYTKYYFIYNVDLRAVTLGILRRPDLGFVGAQFGYFAYHNHKFGRKPQLWKVQNGALTEIGTSINNWFSDVSQMIEIFLTRRQTDGQFTMWTRDNNHPTWTQYVQGTDNTFTSDLKNLKSLTYADAGNQMQIHDVWSWPYGDSLLPTDVPELADY